MERKCGWNYGHFRLIVSFWLVVEAFRHPGEFLAHLLLPPRMSMTVSLGSNMSSARFCHPAAVKSPESIAQVGSRNMLTLPLLTFTEYQQLLLSGGAPKSPLDSKYNVK
jgi:hypothetical protein